MGTEKSKPAAKSGGAKSVWILVIAAIAGIFTGIFLGDYAAIFRPVGKAYLMLLEVAVYPYLISALLVGLISMTPAMALRLFRTGWPFYLGLWAMALGMMWLLSQAIPQRMPLSMGETGSAGALQANHILELFIPRNLIAALGNNYVPAVVMFCFCFGIAFQKVKDKTAMLSILDGIRQASLTFWGYVVKLLPIGSFALLADRAGTMRIHELSSVGLYFTLFGAGVLILAFWFIPGVIASLTPLKHSEVIKKLGPAVGISLLTCQHAASIPMIIEATRELAEKCGIDDPERDDLVKVNFSIAYPLGMSGNFFTYLFVIFAAFAFDTAVPTFKACLLPLLSLMSSFGTSSAAVGSITFVGDVINLPEGAAQLYVAMTPIMRYGQVVASVMGISFLSFMVVIAYFGKLSFRWKQLLSVLAAGAVVALAVALTARMIYAPLLKTDMSPYPLFTVDPALTKGVGVTWGREETAEPLKPGETIVERIRRTGVVRVGYADTEVPFCYRNSAGQLAGYDVAFAYQLARDLNADIEFIPFEWDKLRAELSDGIFDIVMSGIYFDNGDLDKFGVSAPYFQSPLAFLTPRTGAERLLSRESIRSLPSLNIGTYGDADLVPVIETTFPGAKITVFSDYHAAPDFSHAEVVFLSLAEAEAMAAENPGTVAVAPADVGSPLSFVYLMPPHSEGFVRLVDYWLSRLHGSAFEKAQEDYWIKRIPRRDSVPRWSILRDVLGHGKNAEAMEPAP